MGGDLTLDSQISFPKDHPYYEAHSVAVRLVARVCGVVIDPGYGPYDSIRVGLTGAPYAVYAARVLFQYVKRASIPTIPRVAAAAQGMPTELQAREWIQSLADAAGVDVSRQYSADEMEANPVEYL